MEPQKAGAQELYKQLKAITEAGKQALEEMRRNAANVSESVRDNLKEAKDTGNKEIYETVKSLFTENYSLAGSLDKQVETSLKGFNTLERRGAAINQALEAGKINEEQAAYMMQVQLSKAKKGQKNVSEISNAVALTTRDLHESDAFMRMVYQYENFNEDQKKAAENAQRVSTELHKQADTLEELRDALDKNSKTYEQDSKQLLNRAQAARRGARNSDLIIEKLKRENEEISLLVASYKKGDKAADITEKIQKSRERVLALDNKIEASRASAEKTEQNVAAQEEKRNNAAEEQAKKRAEAEEKAAQKAAEAEQRRQAQAEQAALKQKQLQEAEIYRTELLGKSKLQLAAIIKQLNSDMKAAGEARDFEQLDALKQKMSIARSAMRNASMQANITRMTFMQQAQTAGRLSNNISTLADGFGALSEGAKNGQLNLTGMASSLMDLWFTMKAGMGPIGWMMMGLQAIQGIANNYIQNSNKIKKAEEDKASVLKSVAAAYESIETAQKNSDFNKAYNAEVQALKEKYDGIHETLKTNLELIDKATQAELRHLSITAEEEQLQRALNKMELSRLLEAGEISKAEYEESLLNMDYAEALSAAERKREEAEIIREAASKKEINAEGYAKTAEEKAEEARNRENDLGMNTARFDEITRQRAVLEAQRRELELNEKAFYAGEKSFDLVKGFNEATAAGIELFGIDVNKPTETAEQIAEAYTDMHKALSEALLGLMNEQNAVARKLGTGAYGDFNEVETRNAIRLVEENRREAEATAKEAAAQHKEAQKKLAEANEATDLAAEEESRIKKAKKREFDSQQESIKARDTAEKKRKKREERMEKMLEDVDELTLSELTSMRSKAKKQAGKLGEGTAPRKQYEDYIKRIDREIKSRRKAFSDVETAAEAEVQSRAGSNKALAKYSKLLNKVDFKGLSGVLDDGSISESELKLLQREWVDAVKARNATAMAFIQKIIQDAAESKRQDEAIVGAINSTKKKMEKQAQRMQKKLKTTLK